MDFVKLSRRFHALSDANRLRIVELLAGKERCVCDISEPLGISQPLMSFHLKTLRQAGLVRARREGRWTYYALEREALQELGEGIVEVLGAHDWSQTTCAC